MGEVANKRRWLSLVIGAMVVIGIMVVMVITASMSGMKLWKQKNPRLANVYLVDDLTNALGVYRLDYGCYPWPKPDEVKATTEIRNADVYRAITGGKREYLGNVSPKHLKTGVLVDTWGNPIIFRVDSKNKFAVIWSCGPNGRDETNTGASPDPAKLPKTYYLFRGPSTGDDIVSE